MSMSTSMSMPNVPLYPPQQYPAQYAQQQSLTRVTRGLDSEDSEGGGGYDDNGNDNGNGRGSQAPSECGVFSTEAGCFFGNHDDCGTSCPYPNSPYPRTSTSTSTSAPLAPSPYGLYGVNGRDRDRDRDRDSGTGTGTFVFEDPHSYISGRAGPGYANIGGMGIGDMGTGGVDVGVDGTGSGDRHGDDLSGAHGGCRRLYRHLQGAVRDGDE